ncbi:uncharacterized protein LOC114915601, partial [Cajanus cajan]|uniref:uncharacterized protein LOC114915601 n=1 Tax=Cajanus cajan TaxID=3821 RepID=UPI0010FAD2EE
MFRDLKISLPFDDYFMSILRLLNVAPSQLHPNTWAAMQGFRHLCLALGLQPTPHLFLHFYTSRPTKKAKWLSLIRHNDCLLQPFTTSYKKFKVGFMKVMIRPEPGKKYFFDAEGNPLFPLYWTRKPRKYDTVSKSRMSPEERMSLSFLDKLPRPLPCRPLIRLFESADVVEELIGIMAAHGDDDLDIRNLIRNQLAATIGNKTSAPMGGNQATVQAGGVGSSARKKKPTRPQPEKRRPDARAEEESRRAKQRRVASPPVPEGLSSPSFLAGNVNAQDFLSQDLTSEAGQGMLSRMSSAQKWSFFCEFQVRAVAMAQSIVMQPNGEADGLRRQLAEQEKYLQETLAALTDAQTSNSKYQAEMDRRGRVADDLALKVQRLELALKTETDKVTALGKGLDAEKTAFEAYKEKARAKVLSQHQAGFAQAAR